jgi:hypothetical protein
MGNSGKQRFIIRAVFVFALIVVALSLLTIAVDRATARFGGAIWFALLPGILAVFFGLLGTWAGTGDLLDWRSLKGRRVDPSALPTQDGTIAISGRVLCESEPLRSPLFERPCAGYLLRITGERRSRSSSGSAYRSQLCGLEFALADAVLDADGQRLKLLALPDVDIAFREIGQGGERGRKALHYLDTIRSDGQTADEASAEGRLIAAQARWLPPAHERLFIAETQTTSNQMSLIEDHVPIDTTVTILGHYRAARDELNGQRRGGMKLFAGNLDEATERLGREGRKTLGLAAPMVMLGTALLSCGYWWPQ